MSTEKTGGPAFPTSHEEPADFNGHNDSKKIVIDRGMTLRDYFAAKAMQGIQSRVNWSVEAIADLAYKQADEMLEARK
jgi:hypothetical protein